MTLQSYRIITGSLVLLASSAAYARGPAAVVVTVENRAPEYGTYQTPLWVGFHDGCFDSYDAGMLADALPIPGSDAVERIAEDGNVGPLIADFDTAVNDGVQPLQRHRPRDDRLAARGLFVEPRYVHIAIARQQ